jgi:cytochrome c oxidase subunit II
MFSNTSNFSASVDKTFLFIIGISFIFLIGITTTMIVFVIKYNRKKHPKAIQIKDNIALEITWTVVPLIIVLLMFFYGYFAFIPERNPPKGAIPVRVIGRMWNWTFDYGNGKINSDTLVVPVSQAVKLDMNSLDVNHSLYIPAFRIKEDLIPGKTTHLWFIAERPGNFDILCTAYCGLRHSYMEGIVKVVSYEQYKTWLANLKITDISKEPKGLTIIKHNGCTGCHSLDGSKLVGPSFKGLFGTERIVLTEGVERKIMADSIYINTSIIEPDKDIVVGFRKGFMHSYKEVMKESDIHEIINYLKILSANKN